MLNSRDVGLLRQDVAANCRIWLERCRAAGLNVLITNTVRDREYQEFLYARGRTRPGSIVTNGRVPTFHSDAAGLAWDFCQNIQGKEYSDPAFFRAAAELAKEMGFSWGGDWRSFPDSPHIQWDAGKTWTSAMILAGKLPPPMPLFAAEQSQDKEDEQMTAEQFDKLMQGWLEKLNSEPPAQWSQDARKWAEENGLISGDGQGNLQYRSLVTREQLMVFLQRLADKMGQ